MISKLSNNNWEGECFLIADDDRYNHMLLDKLFSKTRAKLVHAYNGIEAVELFLINSEIRFAIIDIKMPGKNGYDVAETIRLHRPEVIMIAYTADIIRLDLARCKELGFAKCLAKPLLPIRFMEEMESLLTVKQ